MHLAKKYHPGPGAKICSTITMDTSYFGFPELSASATAQGDSKMMKGSPGAHLLVT